MNAVNCYQRLKRIDFFIRQKSTGQPSDFAKRLKISRATLYRNLNDLRNMGAHIQYSKERMSFFYEEPFELVFP